MSISNTTGTGARVPVVHRIGAVVVALVIGVFGVLGLIGGLGFFDTTGTLLLGLSPNGALSTVSVVTALALIAAAVRGGRSASTVMIVIGVLFLVSAFVNLWLIGRPENLLAFRLPNVFFSIGAGLVLLVLGAHGRVTGRPTVDNPYRSGGRVQEVGDEPAVPLAPTRADADADVALAEAERAAASGSATVAQQRGLAAVAGVRTPEERRAVWRSWQARHGA